MLLIFVRALFICFSASAFATYVSAVSSPPDLVSNHAFVAFTLMMIGPITVIGIDLFIRKKRVEDVSAIYFGLLIGILLSYLLTNGVKPIFEQPIFAGQGTWYYNGVVLISSLVLPYFCISFLLQTKDDFRFIIPYVEFSRELKGGRPLVLDATALIDGRVSDLVDTNAVDSMLVIPSFVVSDLQEIADSGDKVRRNRGRRGLDILNKLQQNPRTEVKIHDVRLGDDRSATSKDQRVVELAKLFSGRIVTNDINLSKLAHIHSLDVVNINDVSNALKPRYLPGEHLRIRLIKEGEAAGQGVGYLDDGTMVVCEQAYDRVGEELDVEVTSVLQNSAGRMIFSKVPGQTNIGQSPSGIRNRGNQH
jgi:uncharacterized protein YacL